MTLITYPTRVHFADHVLEEALHSELERAKCKAPLLVLPHLPMNTELEDRVRVGLPTSSVPQLVTYSPDSNLSMIAKDVVTSIAAPDVIIAFGEARAIELARKCRHAFQSKSQRRLPLYAVPGVDGLPGPCTRNLESWRAGLPSVLICDPTVALGAGQAQSQRSAVLSLVRCYESYVAAAYNPLADGIALDGLNRCVINLPKIRDSNGVDLHRELMAAGLNAALSQEKGIGPTLAMSAVLTHPGDGLEEADLARLILPAVIRAQDVDADKEKALMQVIGSGFVGLAQAVERVLAKVDGPTTLADLGVSRRSLDGAAEAAVGKGGFGFETARRTLENIYEEVSA